jgi:Ser/Thr protein kinase RdoA (MazF antagonist)
MDTNKAFTKISPKQMGFLVHELVGEYADGTQMDTEWSEAQAALVGRFIATWATHHTGAACTHTAVHDYLELNNWKNQSPEHWTCDLEDMLEDGKVIQ